MKPALLAGLVAVSFGCGASSTQGNENPTLSGGDTGLTSDGSVIDPGLDAAQPDVPYDPDAACAARSFSGQKLPLTIAIVFDESSSMSTGGRINIAKSGLKAALTDPKFDDVAVSLFRFGYLSGLSGCTDDTKPFFEPKALSVGRTELFSAIDMLSASGATPTFSGLNDAYAWLAPKIAAKTPPLDGKVAVILVTDGAPTCAVHSLAEYVALVKKARSATIDTFVIGLPGSGAPIEDDPAGTHTSVLLTEIAAAGTDATNLPKDCDAAPTPVTAPVKKPCYFDLEKDGLSVDTLSKALDSIRKASSSCEYGLPTAGPAYDSTNPGVVVVDGAGTAHTVAECADPKSPPPDGCWVWSDAKKTRVRIVGAACDIAKTDDKSRVDVLLQCRVK